MVTVVEKTYPVTSTGVGRPDYQGEQWLAKTFKRINLHENEAIVAFSKCFSTIASPYPNVVAPLAVAATANLMDASTGIDMPYTILAGYELEVLMVWASLTENTRQLMYFDTLFITEYYLDALKIYYESEVHEFSSAQADPTFATAHTIRFAGTNIGLGAMRGFVQVVCILRSHGTEKLTTKTVRCKHCGALEVVPIGTTLLICKKCGKKTRYFVPRVGNMLFK